MIQIDDAGSGSLVGGTLIGIIRTSTLEYYYDIIPIKYFQYPHFQEKKFEDYCIKIVENGIKKLNINKNEEINICRGYIFNKTRNYLTNKGFKIFNTKITDPLQSLVENTFKEYIINLGVPQDYINYTRYPFHFHKLLRWVLADPKNRIKLCKTGWNSWQKYINNIKIEKHTDYIFNGNFVCLKCGNKINPPSKIKVLKFYTNKEYLIYLHYNCHSFQ
ncbi:hypothetical protein SAMN05660865_00939 [Caloramator fervidus]|uniref:Uncharacterized protein n=1 Tax=Caloramator fervidus TaxID=29344 RepID=A0A1H5UPT0_9CLOT|nr:hypothetical protein [Caloramator fervidus]SEF76197.1 hypothetical protein SAMN05660865_00939 [Caloramator fervidus]